MAHNNNMNNNNCAPRGRTFSNGFQKKYQKKRLPKVLEEDGMRDFSSSDDNGLDQQMHHNGYNYYHQPHHPHHFYPPSPPRATTSLPASSLSSSFLLEQIEQEKVSVRLDQNQGLVVAREDDDLEDHAEKERKSPKRCRSRATSPKSNSKLQTHPSSSKSNGIVAIAGPSSSKAVNITIPSMNSIGFVAATENDNDHGHNYSHKETRKKQVTVNVSSLEANMEEAFRIAASVKANQTTYKSSQPIPSFTNRPRKGSTGDATTNGISNPPALEGLSSTTPLMDSVMVTKEQHKILVTPTASMLKSRKDESSINLCCALVFGFSASLFFSLTLLLAKVLKNRDHNPISIAFWRYLGVLLPSIPLGLFYLARGKKQKVVGVVWPIRDMDKAATALALLMRGVLGSTAVILRFSSLHYITIADSTVISYCAPVFAAIFAPFCVKKERGVFVPIVCGFAAAFGIFAISRPPFLGWNQWDPDNLKGVFLSTLSMLCSAGVLIIVRNLLQKVHFSLMMIVLGLWGVFEAGVLALSLDVLKVPTLLPDIVMMFGVAVLTFFGQLFILIAMRMGRVGSVSVIRSCDILFSFAWQHLFLKTEPQMLGILSAVLIILTVWFICFRRWIAGLRPNNTIRERFSCFLY